MCEMTATAGGTLTAAGGRTNSTHAEAVAGVEVAVRRRRRRPGERPPRLFAVGR